MARPKPLPPENDEVVFGVSSVLLSGSAEFWAEGEDAEAPRVELGGGRHGGVPVVEAWRQALRRDLAVLGIQVRSAVLQAGTTATVYLAEADDRASRLRGQEEMIEHGAAEAARRQLERRLPVFERYRAGLPPFVQRRHADALDAAREKAERELDAIRHLYPPR